MSEITLNYQYPVTVGDRINITGVGKGVVTGVHSATLTVDLGWRGRLLWWLPRRVRRWWFA